MFEIVPSTHFYSPPLLHKTIHTDCGKTVGFSLATNTLIRENEWSCCSYLLSTLSNYHICL